MANIPSIPPLLSSTPPPLDFDDNCDAGDEAVVTPLSILSEDYVGDFDTFAETLQSTDIDTNPDGLSLPRTPMPLSSNFDNSIDDCIVIPADSEADNVEFIKNEDPNGTKSAEAFNYCIATAIFESNSPPPLDLDAIVTNDRLDDEDFQEFCTASQESDPGGGNSSDDVQEEYSAIKTDDNLSLPSLKFDTLSISSEKCSGCSHLSPSPPLLDYEKKTQICDVLADNEDNVSPNESSQLSLDVVQLEDLEDDSSDEEMHSMKKEKNTVQDEKSDDFFAIRKINDDKQTVFSYTSSQNNFVSIHSKAEMKAEERRKGSDEEINDFGDFKNVSVSKFTSETSTKPENLITENEIKETAEQQQFEDEFDDFQDYSEVATVPSPKENITLQQFNTHSSIVATAQMEDSEDEFGEFSDATLTPSPSVVVAVPDQSISIPGPVSISNPNDKLLPILEMMFPNVGINTEKSMEAKSINTVLAEDNNKHLKMEAIDTANALDYNWTKSEVRHSLIRSLGIDSRNILFGDKWNNLMPRFAANLTFNPLEPLKPQQVLKQNDSSHSNVTQRALHKTKHDVPAAEFDWNTSGLVNPLDGPKEVSCGRKTETFHTSQSGAFNASTDSQSSRSNFASTGNEDAGKLAINSDLNATPASPAAADSATTTTISPFITTDSVGYIISDSGNNTDLSVGLQIESDLITNVIPVPLTPSTFVVKDTSYNSVQSTSYKNSTKFGAENAFDCKADFSENNVDEVVATSTFAGPLKETHIYTPSKQDSAAATKAVGLTTKTAPIDFDYEIAAAGIRINEKVVKKEYRDVEYNPGFGLSRDLQTITDNSPKRSDLFTRKELENHASLYKSPQSKDVSELDDEFSDFQYVSPEQLPPSNLSKDMKPSTQSTQSVAAIRSKDSAPTVSRGEMILSPSILLPQAIPLENNKPKIEWGDTTASINPEELARIEELFPQPKTETSLHKATPQQNGYQHQTSVKQPFKSLSISASVAQKEHQVDDDDWSEFVSVPVVNTTFQQQQSNPKLIKFNAPNNNLHMASCVNRMQQLGNPSLASALQTTKPNEISAASEEEWSDFVSSTPHLNTDYRTLPQFNSAAWQDANFYNNPLSFYQNQTHANGVPMHKNNNNTMITNFNCNKVYKQYDQSHYQQHQEVHIMPDFSTAPPSQRRSPITAIVSERNTQFQVGTAKVAPSISLIPDLGFVAPSVPTAFVNTLLKPGFSMNK